MDYFDDIHRQKFNYVIPFNQGIISPKKLLKKKKNLL